MSTFNTRELRLDAGEDLTKHFDTLLRLKKIDNLGKIVRTNNAFQKPIGTATNRIGEFEYGEDGQPITYIMTAKMLEGVVKLIAGEEISAGDLILASDVIFGSVVGIKSIDNAPQNSYIIGTAIEDAAIGSKFSVLADIYLVGTLSNNQKIDTWYPRPSPKDYSWTGLAWSDKLGLFCAVSDSGATRVMLSSDALNWYQPENNQQLDSNGKIISSDIPQNNYKDVCFSEELGLFVAVASSIEDGNIMTSLDGKAWTARTGPNSNWRSIVYAAGKFVAVASSGDERVMTSVDGVTWNGVIAGDGVWSDVIYADSLGLFIAVAKSGPVQIMTSVDGITWIDQIDNINSEWTSLAWSESLGVIVAVARGGVGNRIMTSIDGVTWDGREQTENNKWNDVSWSDDLKRFVSISEDGMNTVMSSEDSIIWKAHKGAATNEWTSLAWSKPLGLFGAVARSGVGNRVMTSRAS
ncbi:MAG: hypothetical protein V3T09_08325 [bacterium]